MSEPEEAKKPAKEAKSKKPLKAAPIKYDLDKETVVPGKARGATASFGAEASKRLSETLSSGLSQQLAHIANQMPNISDYLHRESPMSRISDIEMVIPENPAHETNRLLREVSQKLDNLNEQNSKLVKANYDPASYELIFANKKIPVPPSSNMAKLCATLFRNEETERKAWGWIEVLEDWDWQDIDIDNTDGREVYRARRNLNSLVAEHTTIKDLLIGDTKVTKVNPRYLELDL